MVVSALTPALAPIDFDTVTRDLERAVENADKDPEDGVTSACAVVERVCRSILVELQVTLPAKKDVQTLYKAVRERLSLDPGATFAIDVISALHDAQAALEEDAERYCQTNKNVVRSVGSQLRQMQFPLSPVERVRGKFRI